MNDPTVRAAFDAVSTIYATNPERVMAATKHKGDGDARKTALAILSEYGYTYRHMSEVTGSSIRSIGRAVSSHHEICTIDAKYREAWQQARRAFLEQVQGHGE